MLSSIFYVEGQTVQHHQPISNQLPKKEFIMQDGISPLTTYPYDLSQSNISILEIKLESTILTIKPDQIIADKPILIQTLGSTIRIWNYVSSPNYVISDKGVTYIDGYNMLDWDANPIKITNNFGQSTWTIHELNLINNFNLVGSNNKIFLDVGLESILSVNVMGLNTVDFNKPINALKVDMSMNHSTINFHGCVCDHFKLIIKGTGSIVGLTTTKTANINIVGPVVLTLNKTSDTIVDTNVVGTGKIIWL